MCLFDTFHGCSGSIKEINRPMLIWKIMSNIYYWEKVAFSKLRFSRKEILKETLKSKKVQGKFGGTFILALSSSAVIRLQKSVSDFF